eukprot:Clim_evm15s141 gene=Clim_evmTU15s141
MTSEVHIDVPAFAEERIASSKKRQDERMKITYEDVNFEVYRKLGRKEKAPPGVTVSDDGKGYTRNILKNINGTFEPGRLTAIMGASGAGKTTLLNAIAGNFTTGTLKGKVSVNGKECHAKTMAKLSGFVYQEDLLLDTQTVREVIYTSARLRLPKAYSDELVRERVEDIIDMLHLSKVADTYIGDTSKKGISGGEKKRTAVAVEMITNPAILYLDEPTSGLDTFTAFSVVKNLHDLAEMGRTVVATIHQPSSEIFFMFDDVVLLADGEVMYHGPVRKIVEYFAKRGYPTPTYSNPADFLFMKVLNTTGIEGVQHVLEAGSGSSASDEISNEDDQKKSEHLRYSASSEDPILRIRTLLGLWPRSEEYQELMLKMNKNNGSGLGSALLKSSADMFLQFKVLAARNSANALRNPLIVRAKFGSTIFIALIMGLIYLDIGLDQESVQGRLGSLFFIAVNYVFSAAIGTVSVFGMERKVFEREYAGNFYGLTSYFVSKVVTELPYSVIFPMIGSAIMYWMIGYQADAGKFFIYTLTLILLANAGGAIGIFAGCAFSDLAVANAILPLIILPLMIFSGFFVNDDNIPPYFDWIKYLSPMKYGFSVLAQNEFDGLEFECEPNQPCFENGQQVIDAYNLADDGGIAENLIYLTLLYIGLMICSYFALYMLVRKTRKNK